ncbi:hypothetical protein [Bartonella tribocorum]|uniref:hypothetical protein n=1 Tax=Bartonella tribocorum TaxID=85701 RepID=UPI0011780FA1|nr:hypothetical protein [Bartonella tribocorum]
MSNINVIAENRWFRRAVRWLILLDIIIFVFMKYKIIASYYFAAHNVPTSFAFERGHEKRYLVSYHKEFLSSCLFHRYDV